MLDKAGQKMSKRLGNAVDPFETLERFGPDATRWYMITNAQPWDNLRFDTEGIAEVQRKFFGTLHNTYAFLALVCGHRRFRPHLRRTSCRGPSRVGPLDFEQAAHVHLRRYRPLLTPLSPPEQAGPFSLLWWMT